MTLRHALTALFLLPPSALHAESPITITDRAVIIENEAVIVDQEVDEQAIFINQIDTRQAFQRDGEIPPAG